MKILAIETSCDDTCISILEVEKNNFTFLSDVVSSQAKLHEKWGGVYPALAKREHQKNLVPVLRKALEEASLLEKGEVEKKNVSAFLQREKDLSKSLKEFLSNFKKPKIDALAVTVGPGLDPSLWVGINFAKALSFVWDLKIIPVNHIKAHFFSSMATDKISFPVISLIVSGGHTQLVLSKDKNLHKVIGSTRDDAAGECFDKTARIIGLKYPGGPEIEKLAKKETEKKVALPRPMIGTKNYDFSFSGLKTAVLYRWREEKIKDESFKIAMAKEIQKSITDVLVKKTFRAVKDFQAKTVILGGGVSANSFLREKMKEKAKESDLRLVLPDKKISTDNARMIAITAFHEYQKGNIINPKDIISLPNLKIK